MYIKKAYSFRAFCEKCGDELEVPEAGIDLRSKEVEVKVRPCETCRANQVVKEFNRKVIEKIEGKE